MKSLRLVLVAGALAGLVAGPVAACPERYADPAIDIAVAQAAWKVRLPSDLVKAVLIAESGCNGRAVSPKGAMGLMQLMPPTWRDLRHRLTLGSDPFDAGDNILAGATYLRELHDQFGPSGMLAAYNAGPGRYQAHLRRGQPLPQETRLYVARVRAILDGKLVPIDGPALNWRAADLFAVRPSGMHLLTAADDVAGQVGEILRRESAGGAGERAQQDKRRGTPSSYPLVGVEEFSGPGLFVGRRKDETSQSISGLAGTSGRGRRHGP
jgi:hypothetical protein